MIALGILDIIEFILEILVGAMFVRAFFKRDDREIKRFGIALIIILLCLIRGGQL